MIVQTKKWIQRYLQELGRFSFVTSKNKAETVVNEMYEVLIKNQVQFSEAIEIVDILRNTIVSNAMNTLGNKYLNHLKKD